MINANIKFEGNLVANLTTLDQNIQRGVLAAAHYTAPVAEAYMKANAPWIDRTSAARNGLRAQVVQSGSRVGIVMYHSVPYGVFLEVRWGGKYGIILNTMQMAGPVFITAIKRLAFKG
jgi:hypothetical protein